MTEANRTELPVNETILFSNHKEKQTRSVEKRQREYLKKLDFLGPFLRPGEEIILITTACTPMSLFEQLTTGSIVYYVKRALLVFTDQRVFHIPTTRSFQYRHSIAQFEYAGCKSMKMSFGALKVQYKTGKKESFLYVGRGERKKVKALIPDLPIGGPDELANEDRTYLCPRCTSKLVNGDESCRTCRLAFKNRKDARLMSVFLPGGGYFYTRHPIMGFFDAMVEIYLVWVVYLFALGELSSDPGAMGAAIVTAVILVLEKLVTIYHSNHFLNEFLPVEKDIKVRAKASQDAPA